MGDEAIKAPLSDDANTRRAAHPRRSVYWLFSVSPERVWIPARAIVDLLQPEQMDINRVRGSHISSTVLSLAIRHSLMQEMADLPGTNEADILTMDIDWYRRTQPA